MENQRSNNSPKKSDTEQNITEINPQNDNNNENSPSKNATTATTTSPATPRMPVPFARVMSEELLRAPQINASRSRRRVILIETPSSNDRSGSSRRNNRRLINPKRVRRNLFDEKNINQRPPTPTTDNDSDEN